MLKFLKQEANKTYTENGAATYATTRSDCLDLFAAIGALRHAEEREVIDRFHRAWAEDPDLAVKTLFFARDVRGGLGERKVFRTILRYLAENHPETVRKNVSNIAFYGRWDDLLVLLDTPCRQAAVACIRTQLGKDLENLENDSEVSLLGKWLPSVNTSCAETVRQAKALAKELGMTDAVYRKTLSKLRARIRILENHLRTRDYSFDYAKQPSRAMLKYRKAFFRNDGERYGEFLQQVEQGKAALHTGTLYPHDIIRPFFDKVVTEEERRAINTTWNGQENFAGAGNALVVLGGAGSMYGGASIRPIEVASSLAIYFAERNTGTFRNHFITFSRNPQLVEIKGKDILDKVRCCASYDEVANTDLQKTFRLILDTAVRHRVPQKQMPKKLYIISDMEFDACVEGADVTNFEAAKNAFAEHGYELPQVVFWNVDSRNRQQPVTMNEKGVALVSGASPRVFSLLQGDILSPYAVMLEVLGSERYANVAA